MEGKPPMSAPKPLLSVTDGVFLTVGMVIGVGIFKAPSIVAGNTSGTGEFLFAWLLGGVISLCGALVYAELAARHPETGGEYAFLQHAFGRGVSFLFAWSRMTVIQTGAIAAVAFVFGEYASEIHSLGAHSTAIYAPRSRWSRKRCRRSWRPSLSRDCWRLRPRASCPAARPSRRRRPRAAATSCSR
jgi:amino acid transporter